MPNSLDPRIRQWYRHLDKGQPFFVTAIDESSDTIEVQHFDGDVEEFSFSEWDDLEIAVGEAPANWTGPQDSADKGVQGDVTETSRQDWDANLREQHTRGRDSRPLPGADDAAGPQDPPGEDGGTQAAE